MSRPEPITCNYAKVEHTCGHPRFTARAWCKYQLLTPTNNSNALQVIRTKEPTNHVHPMLSLWKSSNRNARFTRAPIMRRFDPSRKIRVETDASQFAVGAIFSLLFENDQWHPIAFVSRKLQPEERIWETYDQELLGVVYAFKMWRHCPEGAQHTIKVYTDHNNLRAMRDVQKLNPRQARWAVYLGAFDFEMLHRKGTKKPADGPSRRPVTSRRMTWLQHCSQPVKA